MCGVNVNVQMCDVGQRKTPVQYTYVQPSLPSPY